MTRRAATTLWAMAAGALIGAYLAAMNCPTGWWASANAQAASERIIGGVIVGVVVGWVAGLGLASRREKTG